ncbi:hypothetical protein LTR95_003629 [Oleoguttula sp. CCFEE 5521]
MKIITLGGRFGQACAAAIVLGLSSIAIKWQTPGYSPPPQTGFSAFVGAYGLIVAAIGAAAIFLSFIRETWMIALDGLAVACFAVAGIVLSIKMSGLNCSEDFSQGLDVKHQKAMVLFDGGEDADGRFTCQPAHVDERTRTCDTSYLTGQCHTITADAAFLWITFMFCVAAGVLAWRLRLRGSTRRSTSAA